MKSKSGKEIFGYLIREGLTPKNGRYLCSRNNPPVSAENGWTPRRCDAWLYPSFPNYDQAIIRKAGRAVVLTKSGLAKSGPVAERDEWKSKYDLAQASISGYIEEVKGLVKRRDDVVELYNIQSIENSALRQSNEILRDRCSLLEASLKRLEPHPSADEMDLSGKTTEERQQSAKEKYDDFWLSEQLRRCFNIPKDDSVLRWLEDLAQRRKVEHPHEACEARLKHERACVNSYLADIKAKNAELEEMKKRLQNQGEAILDLQTRIGTVKRAIEKS